MNCRAVEVLLHCVSTVHDPFPMCFYGIRHAVHGFHARYIAGADIHNDIQYWVKRASLFFRNTFFQDP